MAEAKSRREATPTRTRARSKSDLPPDPCEGEIGPIESTVQTEEAIATVPVETEERPDRNGRAEEDRRGFDDEVNNRYEEIKRGSTHISELQQMTMPQLLKIAKEEGLSDYTGLKKQDLIFKILK